MPERVGVPVSEGTLLHIPAAEVAVGDIIIRGYVRKVTEVQSPYMGYLRFTVAAHVPANAVSPERWAEVGTHQHLPESFVMVVRQKQEG